MASCGKVGEDSAPAFVRSDHISCQSITAFAQDTLGFIWIGTARGLNRYDSEGFNQYYNRNDDPASLPANNITSLLVDSSGTLWVGTGEGLCRYDAQKDLFQRIESEGRIRLVNNIWEALDGRIMVNFIGSLGRIEKNGSHVETVIDNFDPDHGYSNQCHPDGEGNFWSVTRSRLRLYGGRECKLLLDLPLENRTDYSKLLSDGSLYLCSGDKTSIFDTRMRKFSSLPQGIATNREFRGACVSLIHELRGGNFLIVADKGFFIYAREYDSLISGVEAAFPFGIPYKDFSCMFTDRQFDLWTGSRNHGFANIYSGNSAFDTDNALCAGLKGRSVTSMSVTPGGLLLLTTTEDEVISYDPVSKTLLEVDRSSAAWERNPDDSYESIFALSDSRAFLLQGDRILQVGLRRGKIEVEKAYPEIDGKPSCISEGKDGSIWLGTASGGIFRMRPGSSCFEKADFTLRGSSIITSLRPSGNGAMTVGLLASNPLYFKAEGQDAVTIPVWVGKPRVDMTLDLLESGDGEIWIATRGSGVFVYDPSTDRTVKVHGLSCEETMSLSQDEKGDIWIATLSGLECYSHVNGAVRCFSSRDGLDGEQFNARSRAVLPSGLMLFGGTHGVSSYDPRFVPEFKHVPLYFEELRIGGENIGPGRRFDSALPLSPEIRLSHRDNHFTLSYAALDFSGHGQTRFEYRLSGYQKEWTDNRSNTEVSFSNLRPGRYLLEVRTAPADERQEPSYASLPIVISPAPWASWWARAMYLLAVIGIVWILYSNRIRILKESEAAKRAELEKAQEKKINEMNMSFFANISHEFRTPLTLISGPVVQLEKTDADPSIVRTVKWNVARMLRLVNQLMDFGKLEEDTLKLQVAPQDIVSLLRQTAGAFAWNMEQKNLTFSSNGLVDSYTCPVDADKVDKIVSNLLSNAMKYTPAGGEIGAGFDVILPDEAKRLWKDADGCKYLKITISDNGPKIPEASLERIFERYYQVENHHNWGTGIGLYFARRLAVLHHGWLRCDNLSGDGLVFTLLLPAEDIYTPEEKASEPAQIQLLFKPDEGSLDTRSATHHDKTVLLVDDDPGIVGYLRQLLQGRFNVRYAYDGKTALENALSDIPDLVISDVTMPGMDGYQLCRKIKDNNALCHIPVILVTAKTTKENQLEGLGTGADAYVTKPFDPDVLLAMVGTLLRNRERVRGLLRSATSMEQVQEEASLSPQDSALMKDLYELMDKELTNQELNINSITDKLYISRTNLYYKIKALTGETPNAFFKNYKLSRAKQLLDSGKYNVSEVADMTGWSNATVFGRNFKGRFSMTPGEYLQSRKK